MIYFTKPLPADGSAFVEADIRALRDYVFEKTLSDVSWRQVAHRWMTRSEREWLLQTARAMQSTRMPRKKDPA